MWQYDKDDNPVLLGVIARGFKCSTSTIPMSSTRISASYKFLPRSLMWTNVTVAITANRTESGVVISSAPSPSLAPLPTDESEALAGDGGGGFEPSIVTVVIGTIAGVLLIGAVVTIVVTFRRR